MADDVSKITRRQLVVAALIALAGACFIFVTAPHGPRFTDDSVNYWLGAENVLHGHYPQNSSGTELTIFPPGMSVLLATLSFVTGSTLHATVAAEFLSRLAIVLLGYLLIRRLGVRHPLATGITIALALDASLLYVTSMTWSEGPMTAAVLAAMLYCGRLQQTKVRALDVLVLAALVDLAFMFRYVGIVAIPAIAFTLVQWNERRWKPATFFVAVSSVAPVALMAYNWHVDGTIFGPRWKSDQSLSDVIQQMASALLQSVPGSNMQLSGTAAVIETAVVAVICSVALLAFVRKTWSNHYTQALTAFAMGYLALLAISEAKTGMNILDARLVMPSAIAGTLLLGAVLVQVPILQSRAKLGVAAMVVFTLAGTIPLANSLRGSGAGRPNANTNTVALVHELQADGVTVASDAPESLRFNGYRQAIVTAPRHHEYHSVEAGPTFDDFVALNNCKDITVVLFGMEDFYSVDELKQRFQVTSSESRNGVTLLRVAAAKLGKKATQAGTSTCR
jgi:hypothetical protein